LITAGAIPVDAYGQ